MKEILSQIAKSKPSEKIPENAFIKFAPKSGKVLFVDGGNSEISGGADFSIQFIRVAAILFDGKNKTKTETAEFYAVFYLEREGDKIVAKTRISNVKSKLNLDEKEFKFYFMNQEFSSFADTTRRIAELTLASSMLENNKAALVVLDGSLETKSDLEKNAMDKLIRLARVQNANLCALSKTTSIISLSGESLPFLVSKSAPKEIFYVPVSDAGNFKTFVLKLHSDSDYIFRCDTLPETGADAFGWLSFVSNDAVFPGYPYGLIEADKIARVSNRERDMLRIELAAKMGKIWIDIEQKERSVNAHSVLDNIS